MLRILLAALAVVLCGLVGACATTGGAAGGDTGVSAGLVGGDPDLRSALKAVGVEREGPQADGSLVRCVDSRSMAAGQQSTDIARNVAKLQAQADLVQAAQGAYIDSAPGRVESHVQGFSTAMVVEEYQARFWACVRMVERN